MDDSHWTNRSQTPVAWERWKRKASAEKDAILLGIVKHRYTYLSTGV